jgi:hypothetical protein
LLALLGLAPLGADADLPEQLQAARSPGDSNLDNNQQFLARGAQRAERYPDTLKTERSASSTGTPRRSNGCSDGEAFPIEGFFHAEAWLGRYLDFTCGLSACHAEAARGPVLA